MSAKRKICVITGTRAEYGLLHWLMRDIESSDDMELQLVVTGMHLSPEFGLTYRQVEADGFLIARKVEMLLSSDTPVGIAKSMGLAMSGFADAFSELEPDLLIVLGDRFEILSAVAAATVARIPTAHLHGGETTEGAIDESFRHSITKMSHLHFVATEKYEKRVIQLGEDPERVFNVGALGVDNISRLDLLSKEEIEASLGFEFGPKNLLITFHPVTLENSTAEIQFNNLLLALDELEDTKLIFTKANADTDGRVINSLIDKYVQENPQKAVGFTSLGQLRYFSVLKNVNAVVGNSSSGLIEAPSFKVGTLNIGDRQKGRIRSASVIDCGSSADEIRKSIRTLYKESFQRRLDSVVNVYEGSDVSQAIIRVIREYDFSSLLKKSFYDL
jgi:GDP/UDP-N,N'-diacetylbacillosamine 2-epimerase (hydrolysing)